MIKLHSRLEKYTTNFLQHISQFLQREGGATAIEYGLIAALIVIAIVTALVTLGPAVVSLFSSVSNNF